MKKFIWILGLSLVLTGCRGVMIEDRDEVVEDEIDSIASKNERATYIADETKEVVAEINNLREKYKNIMTEEEYEFESVYIDLQGQGMKGISFDNRIFNSKDYFAELIEILDNSVAEGLKNHIEDMEEKKINDDMIILKKIGRAVVYAENREEADNYISVKVDFSDIKDEDYGALFQEISDDKYILSNIIIGEKADMIDFVNLNNSYDMGYEGGNFKSIRYNMFLVENNIEKVNILMQAKDQSPIKDEDIDVFTNLLDSLEIVGEERDQLLKEFKTSFQKDSKREKIALKNYKILIEAAKGNSYSSRDEKLIYFSIERV